MIKSRSRIQSIARASVRKDGGTPGLRLHAGTAGYSFLRSALFCIIILLFGSSVARAALPPNIVINNTATAGYTDGAAPGIISALSNTVMVTTVALRTPSTLEIFQYAPVSTGVVSSPVSSTDFSSSGTAAGPFSPLPAPVSTGGAAIDLSGPVPLLPATQYHTGEPMFIRVTDLDQNQDDLVAETILVTVRIGADEVEVIRLTETQPDSGVFSGYLQTDPAPPAPGNGMLNASAGDTVTVSYTDDVDGSDARARTVLVDPFGLVFNSLTGQPVNGATITIVNAVTGQPATVYGDDGVSTFPSTLTSGGNATDSSNRVYSFTPGSYRFPFVRPGNYRYLITPPAGFRAPSAVPTAALQALPGAPFAVVTGSRAEVFAVDPGPALHIDVPIDPTGTRLYIQKTAQLTTAAVGDHVPYRVSVENVDTTGPVTTVVLVDRLPHGFRYLKGTARLDGAPAPDPAVSEDGRTLTFSLGDLAAGQKVQVSYIAAIGAGTRPGTAVNSASATGGLGAVSNVSQAQVEVLEELFREKAFIAGRVVADGCGDPDKAENRGVEGVRIFLEDGTYVVTDADGKYHFAAMKPGSHVVQVDRDTVPKKYEVLQCEENTRFAGSGASQFVDIQGGTLWRADFHLGVRPKQTGNVGIVLSSEVLSAQSGSTANTSKNLLEYSATLDVNTVPVRNVRLTVMLPPGIVYVPGSSTMDGAALSEPANSENVLTYRIDELVSGWTGTVRFAATVDPVVAGDSFTVRAMVTADSPEAKNVMTPPAENKRELVILSEKQATPDLVLRPQFASGSAVLTKKDKTTLLSIVKKLKKLDIKYIRITGHTDSIPIRNKRARFKDNYELAQARAEMVAEFIRMGLRLGKHQVETESRGPDQPVAPNETVKGRSLNRRVEMQVFSIRVVTWAEVKATTSAGERKSAETKGLRPGELWPRDPGANRLKSAPAPDFSPEWVETLQPGFELLSPAPGAYPEIPTIKIAVKHGAKDKVVVRVNGDPVSPLYFDGNFKKSDDGLAVSVWRGVHLLDGDNLIQVEASTQSGQPAGEITRTVHVSTQPVKAFFVPGQSVLTADGRTTPVIAVRLVDKDGHPARKGMLGEFSIDPPHLPLQTEEDLRSRPLTISTSERRQYQVGADGIALIELQPTSRSGEAVVRINLADGVQEVRPWLKSEDRDWILVGMAEGTAGYNSVSGNSESLSAADREEDLYQDGRLAFYAKGKIKGEWLLTMAYDSDKRWKKDENRLHELIDPTKYYTLYGDATTQASDSPSSRPLYLKLEREQFYALFGDYQTGLTVTELSRYSRSMNGFKSEYRDDRFDAVVFASDTGQAFVKDEIRGDGTSGLYHLSRKGIVRNSETVMIETRDRFRSEIIVNRQPLARWIDYTIDYESATIFFKAPVPSRDTRFNPVFIVADYEVIDGSELAWNYGGRGAVRNSGKTAEVGVSYVHEGPTGRAGDLVGMDAKIALDDRTSVRAEVARTRTETGAATEEGSAYLAEVTHRSAGLEGKAYIRGQEQDFGLGQQSGSESGTRKFGLDGLYRFSDAVTGRGEFFRQNNLPTGATRDVASIGGAYAAKSYELGAGFRQAEDQLLTGDARTSQQVFMTSRYRVTDRTALFLNHDQSLAGSDENTDYPTRTTMGVDYRLTDATTLFGAQEFTSGAFGDTATTRVGFRALPWTGSSLNSTIENQETENGERLFAVNGLKQSWLLSPKWSVDASLDRSATIRESSDYQFNTNVPPASGGEDFTAVSLGAGYKERMWSWTGRVEKRFAETEEKIGLFTGAAGDVRPGLGMAGSFQAFKSNAVTGLRRTSADLRLGLAYRPLDSSWMILDRLDYIVEKQEDGQSSFDNWRVVNNMVANVRASVRTQLSFQYGSKYVSETIDSSDFRGYTHLPGLELRYDFTRSWDAGMRVSMLQSFETGQIDYGTGVSIGYTLARNMWLSVGYNLAGFKDRDFSKAEFTAEGPFIKLRLKFDQASAREAVKWFSGQ